MLPTSNTWLNTINKIKNDFNSAMENIPGFEAYNDAERIQRGKKHIEGEQTKIIERLNQTLSNILSDKEKLIKEKQKIYNPHLSDSQIGILSKSLEGELQINNALMFLNTSQPAEHIIQTLNDAIELNRIDFASTIFNKILIQFPKDVNEESELKKDKEKYFLITSVKNIYDKFKKKTGLDKIELELQEFEKLESRIESFKNLVGAGEKFIFSPKDFSKMNNEEKIKIEQFLLTQPVETSVRLKSIMHSESNV